MQQDGVSSAPAVVSYFLVSSVPVMWYRPKLIRVLRATNFCSLAKLKNVTKLIDRDRNVSHDCQTITEEGYTQTPVVHVCCFPTPRSNFIRFLQQTFWSPDFSILRHTRSLSNEILQEELSCGFLFLRRAVDLLCIVPYVRIGRHTERNSRHVGIVFNLMITFINIRTTTQNFRQT
jgi:hypothetical protein